MLQNQLAILFRNVWRNKSYSLLNITGLAIGIASAALIFLWVEDELSYNHNFPKRNDLYSVMELQPSEGKLQLTTGIPMLMAPVVQKEIPGIKNIARVSWDINSLFVLADKRIKEKGVYADSSLIPMLDLQFIYGGSPSIESPSSILISEGMSKRFFGNENPVGKTLECGAKQEFIADGVFVITGVFKDLPQNSSYQFQWVSKFDLYKQLMHSNWNLWTVNIPTLIQLEPSADHVAINKKLHHYLAGKVPGSLNQCFLYSMNDWRLRNHFSDGKQDGGDIKYVQLFSLIALIILLIACINFMNLATARSEKRAKEVGVRKVAGASKGKLIGQFIGEAMVMSFLAVLLAVLLIYLVLPAYNLLVKKELQVDLFQSLHFVFLLSVGAICGLLAGSYPAFYLSSFQPVMVLKGIKAKNSIGVLLVRKGLVIVQFSTSIILIVSTAIVYQQVNYVKNRDLGFSKDNMICMPLQGKMIPNFTVIRDELLNSGLVENAAMSFHEPLHNNTSTDEYSWPGKDANSHVVVHEELVSSDYIPTMHMKLISGRNFYNIPGGDSNSIIINESMAKLMGKEGRIGSIISRESIKLHLQVVGIIKDFVYNDMYGSAAPLLIGCLPRAALSVIISFKPTADLKEALLKTENILKTYNPGFPFEYYFVDEVFNEMFATETLVDKLAGIFATLAIFISCLGLFGLAAYTAERRTKEIGIRKVLGASVAGVAKLVSVDFLKLIFISCLIAFPVAWWAMHTWLQEYQYRTSIKWWVFVLAGSIALFIAVITVGYQAIKAAVINPIKSLRTD